MSLRLNPIIRCYILHPLCLFLGVACGSLKFLLRSVSSSGIAALGRIVTVDNLGKRQIIIRLVLYV